MKKIPIYLTIFLLTTGFFKSNLEKCADYNFRLSNVLPVAEYTTVAIPEARYIKLYKEYLQEKKTYDQARKKKLNEWYRLPKCKSNETFGFKQKRTCKGDKETFGQFYFAERLRLNFNLPSKPSEPSKNETIVKRKFTDKEIERNYKKFLRQSLKTKLRLADKSKTGGAKYLEKYNECVISEKNNPQLFKDKYN